jgi:hypothetical protein
MEDSETFAKRPLLPDLCVKLSRLGGMNPRNIQSRYSETPSLILTKIEHFSKVS